MFLLHLLFTSFLSFSFAQTVDTLYNEIFTHINNTLNKIIPYIYNKRDLAAFCRTDNTELLDLLSFKRERFSCN